MTAQIDDIFRLDDTRFAVAGISEGELFEPKLFDLEASGTCSACWRCYFVSYGLVKDQLVVADLDINLYRGDEDLLGPVINGIAPTGSKEKHDWFNNHYQRLNYPLNYNGALLLADGFIDELYVHMGFHPFWIYRKVIELKFANGVLWQQSDRSSVAAELRTEYEALMKRQREQEQPSREDIRNFFERAFDRTYTLD